MEAGFNGVLASRSLARFVGRPAEDYPGSIRGDMQATIDLKRHDRDTVQGQLAGERFDLLELTGFPLKLDKVDLQGAGSVLQIQELALDWAQQKASIRGVVERSENGLATRLEIDSPGIVMDALRSPSAARPAGEPSDKRNSEEDSFDLWSLPLNGVVSLRSGFVEYRGHRVQGVRAVATLEPRKSVSRIVRGNLMRGGVSAVASSDSVGLRGRIESDGSGPVRRDRRPVPGRQACRRHRKPEHVSCVDCQGTDGEDSRGSNRRITWEVRWTCGPRMK